MSHRERTPDSLEQVGRGAQEQEFEVGLFGRSTRWVGRRHAAMRDLGFTHVVDGGGLSELVEAGAPVSP